MIKHQQLFLSHHVAKTKTKVLFYCSCRKAILNIFHLHIQACMNVFLLELFKFLRNRSTGRFCAPIFRNKNKVMRLRLTRLLCLQCTNSHPRKPRVFCRLLLWLTSLLSQALLVIPFYIHRYEMKQFDWDRLAPKVAPHTCWSPISSRLLDPVHLN